MSQVPGQPTGPLGQQPEWQPGDLAPRVDPPLVDQEPVQEAPVWEQRRHRALDLSQGEPTPVDRPGGFSADDFFQQAGLGPAPDAPVQRASSFDAESFFQQAGLGAGQEIERQRAERRFDARPGRAPDAGQWTQAETALRESRETDARGLFLPEGELEAARAKVDRMVQDIGRRPRSGREDATIAGMTGVATEAPRQEHESFFDVKPVDERLAEAETAQRFAQFGRHPVVAPVVSILDAFKPQVIASNMADLDFDKQREIMRSSFRSQVEQGREGGPELRAALALQLQNSDLPSDVKDLQLQAIRAESEEELESVYAQLDAALDPGTLASMMESVVGFLTEEGPDGRAIESDTGVLLRWLGSGVSGAAGIVDGLITSAVLGRNPVTTSKAMMESAIRKGEGFVDVFGRIGNNAGDALDKLVGLDPDGEGPERGPAAKTGQVLAGIAGLGVDFVLPIDAFFGKGVGTAVKAMTGNVRTPKLVKVAEGLGLDKTPKQVDDLWRASDQDLDKFVSSLTDEATQAVRKDDTLDVVSELLSRDFDAGASEGIISPTAVLPQDSKARKLLGDNPTLLDDKYDELVAQGVELQPRSDAGPFDKTQAVLDYYRVSIEGRTPLRTGDDTQVLPSVWAEASGAVRGADGIPEGTRGGAFRDALSGLEVERRMTRMMVDESTAAIDVGPQSLREWRRFAGRATGDIPLAATQQRVSVNSRVPKARLEDFGRGAEVLMEHPLGTEGRTLRSILSPSELPQSLSVREARDLDDLLSGTALPFDIRNRILPRESIPISPPPDSLPSVRLTNSDKTIIREALFDTLAQSVPGATRMEPLSDAIRGLREAGREGTGFTGRVQAWWDNIKDAGRAENLERVVFNPEVFDTFTRSARVRALADRSRLFRSREGAIQDPMMREFMGQVRDKVGSTSDDFRVKWREARARGYEPQQATLKATLEEYGGAKGARDLLEDYTVALYGGLERVTEVMEGVAHTAGDTGKVQAINRGLRSLLRSEHGGPLRRLLDHSASMVEDTPRGMDNLSTSLMGITGGLQGRTLRQLLAESGVEGAVTEASRVMRTEGRLTNAEIASVLDTRPAFGVQTRGPGVPQFEGELPFTELLAATYAQRRYAQSIARQAEQYATTVTGEINVRAAIQTMGRILPNKLLDHLYFKETGGITEVPGFQFSKLRAALSDLKVAPPVGAASQAGEVKEAAKAVEALESFSRTLLARTLRRMAGEENLGPTPSDKRAGLTPQIASLIDYIEADPVARATAYNGMRQSLIPYIPSPETRQALNTFLSEETLDSIPELFEAARRAVRGPRDPSEMRDARGPVSEVLGMRDDLMASGIIDDLLNTLNLQQTTDELRLARQAGVPGTQAPDWTVDQVMNAIEIGAGSVKELIQRHGSKPGVTSLTDQLWATASTLSRVASGGMLGGLALPNVAYHLTNVVSAPYILTVTMGGRAAAAQTGKVMRGITGAVDSVFRPGANLDAVAIPASKATRGIEYTRGDLLRMAGEFGVSRSQSAAESAGGLAETMRQQARASWGARSFDPTGLNIWNAVANDTDLVWRMGVMRDALAGGSTPQEAVKAARTALLDYGSLTPFERKYINRVFWFWSFRSRMFSETMRALIDNPSSLYRASLMTDNDLSGVLSVLPGVEWDDQDAIPPEYMGSRAFRVLVRDEAARSQYALYGPNMPFDDAVSMLSDVTAMFAGTAALLPRRRGDGRLWSDAVADAQEGATRFFVGSARPPFQFAASMLDYQAPLSGDDTRLSTYLDPRYVETLNGLGAMPMFETIVGKVEERTWPGETVPSYRVSNPVAWNLLKQASLNAGIDRNFRTFGPLGTSALDAAAGREREDKPTMTDGNRLLYALGITPARIDTEEQRRRQVEGSRVRELQDRGR